MAKYTMTHVYTANITHEVVYDLPEGLDKDGVLEAIRNGANPVSCEATDEDFIDDVDWTLDSVDGDETTRCPYCGSDDWLDADEGKHVCQRCWGEW